MHKDILAMRKKIQTQCTWSESQQLKLQLERTAALVTAENTIPLDGIDSQPVFTNYTAGLKTWTH